MGMVEAQKKHSLKISKRNRSHILLILPYITGFAVFIIVPIAVAIYLSFTNFDTVNTPKWIGLSNFINLISQDSVFMQYVLPNTLKFVLIAGPVGYFLGFILAWMLAQIPKAPRTILALIIYSPSMVAGSAMNVIWKTIFSGDATGIVNYILIKLNWIAQPIQFLQSPDYLLWLSIGITIWSSMGIGFLAMLAGVLNVDSEIYEAAYIDGIKTRFQEIIHVTIPSMKPQMLFGAVMAVTSTFNAGSIGVDLSGANPTPRYAAQMIVNHIEDYGFIRYEMGYATAIAVVLLIMVYLTSKFVFKILEEKKTFVRSAEAKK